MRAICVHKDTISLSSRVLFSWRISLFLRIAFILYSIFKKIKIRLVWEWSPFSGKCAESISCGEVAQRSAPRICSVNREVGGSSLTVRHEYRWFTVVSVVDALLRVRAYAAPCPPVHSAECIRNCAWGLNEELPIAAKSRTNKVWITLP